MVGESGGQAMAAMQAEVATVKVQLCTAQLRSAPDAVGAAPLLPRLRLALAELQAVRPQTQALPLVAADAAAGDAHLGLWQAERSILQLSAGLESYLSACRVGEATVQAEQQHYEMRGEQQRPLGAELAASIASSSVRLAEACVGILSAADDGSDAGRQAAAVAGALATAAGAGDVAALAVRHVLMSMQYAAHGGGPKGALFLHAICVWTCIRFARGALPVGLRQISVWRVAARCLWIPTL